jgi:hypothetical protein
MLLDHVLDSGQQIGLVLKAKYQKSLELPADGVGLRHFVAVPLRVVKGRCAFGNLGSRLLAKERSGTYNGKKQTK